MVEIMQNKITEKKLRLEWVKAIKIHRKDQELMRKFASVLRESFLKRVVAKRNYIRFVETGSIDSTPEWGPTSHPSCRCRAETIK